MIWSFYQTKYKKNAYGEQPALYLNGSFVYGDGIVFGLFWTLISALTLWLNDWILFLLFFSTFWLVRSIGETIYWLLQQFSNIRHYEPKRIPFHNIYQNDSSWVFAQIVTQCVTIVSFITTLYLSFLWISQKLTS